MREITPARTLRSKATTVPTWSSRLTEPPHAPAPPMGRTRTPKPCSRWPGIPSRRDQGRRRAWRYVRAAAAHGQLPGCLAPNANVDGLTIVRTSLGKPRWIGAERANQMPYASELAPYGLFHIDDPDEFDRLYRDRLDHIGVVRVARVPGDQRRPRRPPAGAVLLRAGPRRLPPRHVHRLVGAADRNRGPRAEDRAAMRRCEANDRPRPALPRPSQAGRSTVRRPPGDPHRPSKLTPNVQARIVQAIEVGNYLDTAARYGGIAPARCTHGCSAGATTQRTGPSPRFASSWRRSCVRASEPGSTPSRSSDEGDWRAAAFLLERRWPERWDRSLRVRHEARATVRVAPVEMPDDADRVRRSPRSCATSAFSISISDAVVLSHGRADVRCGDEDVTPAVKSPAHLGGGGSDRVTRALRIRSFRR